MVSYESTDKSVRIYPFVDIHDAFPPGQTDETDAAVIGYKKGVRRMFLMGSNAKRFCDKLAKRKPDAMARLAGSPAYPAIRGTVSLYRVMRGVLVMAEVYNLPHATGACAWEVYGFHIHEGTSCTGNASDAFADTNGHYNPQNCRHPQHAGDLPPLFGNNGYAWMAVLTDRFDIRDVMGRTVIVHQNPDDFTSQPSGNAGPKIACGVIEKR